MYRPVLVTAPLIFPVSLDEAKRHCNAEDYKDDDGRLQGYIAAAASYLDGWTGILNRALCEQTWRQDFDGFCLRMRLPLFPVLAVASVKYTDTAGAEQTIAAENYTLLNDDLGAYVEFRLAYSFPPLKDESAAVRIAYSAGYATNAGAWTGPEAIKQAILLLVEHWFENRSAVVAGPNSSEAVTLPFAVDALLAPFRRPKF